MWVILQNNAGWDCFKTPILREGGTLCVFGSHTFVPISWMCKKQASVSHSCSWKVIWSNQFGPQDPNQVHWHQKPTRRHADWEKFHAWRMESSFVFFFFFFEHSPFQFCRVFWSDVEKNTKRFRWRKSHSKIETNDEFGLAMQRKGLPSCYLLLHQKARWKPDTKVKLFWVRKLRSTIERRDPFWPHKSKPMMHPDLFMEKSY